MKVSILLPYPNPHVLDWVLQMEGVFLNIGCISSTQEFRPGYFSEYDDITRIKYFFKNESFIDTFKKELLESDVLITLGVFDKSLILFRKYCKSNIRLIVMSEPFNPINSKPKSILRKSWCYLIRKAYSKIDFLCMGGGDVKKYYLKLGFSKSNYYNFGYFPLLEFKKPTITSEDDPVVIGYMGQLIDRKGMDRVFKMIDYLRYKDLSFEFLIAGEGCYKSQLIDRLETIGQDRFKFKGLLSTKAEVGEFLESIDVLFMPSYFDGWGAVINEGISKSCAIVASKEVYAYRSLFNMETTDFDAFYLEEVHSLIVDKEKLAMYKQESNDLQKIIDPFFICKEVYNLLNGQVLLNAFIVEI